MKNFNIFGVHAKILVLRGGGHEKPISRGEIAKKEGPVQFADLRRGLGKKEGSGVFEGEVDTQCTLAYLEEFRKNLEVPCQNVVWIIQVKVSECIKTKSGK